MQPTDEKLPYWMRDRSWRERDVVMRRHKKRYDRYISYRNGEPFRDWQIDHALFEVLRPVSVWKHVRAPGAPRQHWIELILPPGAIFWAHRRQWKCRTNFALVAADARYGRGMHCGLFEYHPDTHVHWFDSSPRLASDGTQHFAGVKRGRADFWLSHAVCAPGIHFYRKREHGPQHIT